MNDHVVRNSSDLTQIQKAEDWQEDRERDLDYILKHERGRRWLYTLIFDTCHINLRSHVPGDPESTAFNEGARMIGQDIINKIKDRDMSAYLTMVKEGEADE